MVSLEQVKQSNAQIATALPAGLVAVFVGGTSGIGEFSLKCFAKHANKPKIYFVGRSQDAANRILAELKTINPGGVYNFIQSDLSLLANVDEVCRQLKEKEKTINLLYLSTGTARFKTTTSEGLHAAAALMYHSRTRFIVNLLPLLRQAKSLRRVVTTHTAGKEGSVDVNDFYGWKIPFSKARGHGSSMITLSIEILSKQAPEVAFVHDFPGAVATGFLREAPILLKAAFTVVGSLIMPFVSISSEECGERQTFFATSSLYPPTESAESGAGVPILQGLEVAHGINGTTGSGAYSINVDGSSSYPQTGKVVEKLKKDGVADKLWEHTTEEFVRVTGSESI